MFLPKGTIRQIQLDITNAGQDMAYLILNRGLNTLQYSETSIILYTFTIRIYQHMLLTNTQTMLI